MYIIKVPRIERHYVERMMVRVAGVDVLPRLIMKNARYLCLPEIGLDEDVAKKLRAVLIPKSTKCLLG